MNNIQKMRYTNSKIKECLIQHGWIHLYLFPHLKFMKDYTFNGNGFDAFGWKNGDIWFFQFKTNQKPSLDILKEYFISEETHKARFAWVTKVKNNIVLYDSNFINGKLIN